MNRRLLGFSIIVLITLFLGSGLWLLQQDEAAEQSSVQTCPGLEPATKSTSTQPAFVANGLPNGIMHEQLHELVGDWQADKELYIALGTPDNPATSKDLSTHREWVGQTGDRFIIDTTAGTLGGEPYYRQGTLGYSLMDGRYEWNTIDAINANMMTYKGQPCSETTIDRQFSMEGEFTDQGVLGDQYVGKKIKQRTLVKIESADRHTFELYFTPPGEAERLIDKTVYTRR